MTTLPPPTTPHLRVRPIDRFDPDPAVVRRMSVRAAVREGWLPWCQVDGVLVVAALPGRATALVPQVCRELFGAPAVRVVTATEADLRDALEVAHHDHLLHLSAERLAVRAPLESARDGLTRWQRWAPVPLLLAALAGLVLEPLTGLVVVMAVANLLFGANIAFKVLAALVTPARRAAVTRRRLAEADARVAAGLPAVWTPLRDADLPSYTVLVPAYREANVVGKLVRNLGALDYPSDRLEVMLLLEEDDEETIAVASAMELPSYVRIVVVPAGSPQTKPRACNYGLSLARGEYVVIYDAEDRPDPDQLRVAVDAFARDRFERAHGVGRPRPLAVVQASLHYFNADYNVLTRMFAIEYAHWFEAMLPGMDAVGLPLPLGGTSNHFDVAVLREIGAWDPYNVTEDADLGLRVSRAGYRVSVIDSSTGEEACAETGAWIKQRTRWIKGYLMTAAVNTRQPIRLLRTSGVRGVIGLGGLILATPLAFMSYPLALALTAATYVGVQFVGLALPSWLVAVSVATFVGGNLLMIGSAAVAAAWRYNWRIGLFAVFSPVYWLLHSVAAWRALYQVVFDPHRWEKTPHGLTEDYESDAHM